jgi:EAL domain-containing protein (putative c-di-GMP-specific phosphodiesterase class I)/CheY-like chemotaxis protein
MKRVALIADADPEASALVRDVAKLYGLSVESASTAREFERAYAAFEPALIVLDLDLDASAGTELLHFLAQSRTHSRVVLVGTRGSPDIDTAMQLGSDLELHVLGAFAKPLGELEIEAAVERCLADAPRIGRPELERALAQHEIVVFYQPKIDLRAHAPCGAEALLRWRHPRHGIIAPADFIPAFEASGLCWRLTHTLLDEVCGRIVHAAGAQAPLRISFNLSPLVLDDLELPERLARLVEAAGAAPESLVVEVTETAEIRSPRRAADILTRVRETGFELSIDDFGVGHSSLLRLRDLPFSELKIDRSFVMGLDAEPRCRAIVKCLIELAHDLGLTVCAEGVETESIRDRLRALGCDRAQGFLFSRPLPPDDLDRWLAAPPTCL